MTNAERTDILVIGSGFGGAITAYHLAAGGAKVVVLERGPWVPSDEFDHGFELGTSSTRIFDFTAGDGMSVLGGNCVGGGSVVYFATMPRAPGFVFERQGSIGRRMWPSAINRDTLDPWYDRVTEALPISHQTWDQVPYPGGLWAAACNHAGRTANLPNVAIDTSLCTNCNWMMAGCRFDAKRSLLLNYLPAAVSHGAQIRPLHEVQKISRADDWYRVHYNVIDDEDYRETTGSGTIDAKIVIVAAGAGATPVILQRSEAELGTMPHGVGRYFSGNGERLNTAIIDEDKAREVLGLSRPDGTAYAANQIGRGPTVVCWDHVRRLAARALPVRPRAAVLSAGPGHHPGAGAGRGGPGLVRPGQEGHAAALEVVAHHLHPVGGQQRGRVRAAAAHRKLRPYLAADAGPRRSRVRAIQGDAARLGTG